MIRDPEFLHKFALPTFCFQHTGDVYGMTLPSSLISKRMLPFYTTKQILLTHVAKH